MTLRTPFDFAIDPPPADGEKRVAPTDPIDAALGDHTYYMSRRFYFEDGNYTLTIDADDAATLWIGTVQLNSRIVASTQLGSPTTAFLNIPQGDYRLDVILQNIPASTPSYFTLVIKRGDEIIYSSAREGWLLDDSAISDDDLPPPADYRFSLPMFTTLPNWQNGVTERLSWMTDVLESENGSEQRRSVRRNARRQFEAGFMRQLSHRNRLDDFFVGLGSAEFMLPLWHEAVHMNEGIDMEASGVAFPDGELEYREFYKDDLVFVNNGNPDDYDILQVGDVDYANSRFSWKFPPPRPWPIGTRIYPMRTARLLTPPRMSNITDTVSTAQVQFDLSEPYKIAANFGATAGGEPFFAFSPDRATTLDVSYGRKSFTLDNTSGVPITTDHGRFTNVIVQSKYRLFGRINATKLRQFFQAARGRAVHFFAPTFMQDVYVVDDELPLNAQEIIIEPQGFYDYMLRPQPIRIQLAFQFYDGRPSVYTTITGVEPIYKKDADGSNSTPLQTVAEKLSIDPALPAIAMKDVKRVSFVAESRFDQDTFEIQHHSNQQSVIDVSIVMKQAFNPRIGTPA
jgi:hypothetical protein